MRAVGSKLLVEAASIAPTACCPQCQQLSIPVHSRYIRSPRDLPVSELAVRLVLHVRRFFCDNPLCSQPTFAERLPDLVPVRAHRTVRLTHTLQALAFALGGEAGTHLGERLRMPYSPATFLRIMRRTALTAHPTPRVLGVDDFALHKGRVYGTILVDLEQHHPVDLLSERTADSFASWLRNHPGVEVISRDRSTEYTRGASEGAPHALQVADRWHLLHNLREALERVLNRLHTELRALPEAPNQAATIAPTSGADYSRPLRPTSAREQLARQARRERQSARYKSVHDLKAQGVPLVRIAKQLGLSRTTVHKFAAASTFPEHAKRPPLPRLLDPYISYLRHQLDAGCENASQLWREIQPQGFTGTRKQVARWVQQRRTHPAPTGPKRQLLVALPATTGEVHTATTMETATLAAPRELVWLLLREQADLDSEEQATFTRIQQHPTIVLVYQLSKHFQEMIRHRMPDQLDGWLSACATSNVADLQTFAAGLQRDYAAVRAALSEPWSNGQTEGQVTRLKLLKRQMYGRAMFDLLRQRVLYAA